MRINYLRLQNFRCHADLELEFDSGDDKIAILGANGAGKTSVLEAVSVLLTGRSFRATDRGLLKTKSDWYRLDGRFGDQVRIVKYQQITPEEVEKSFTVNNQVSKRLPMKYRQPIVLFQPDDLQLISGSPSRRRRYLDQIADQMFVGYGTKLRQYEQALRQRNRLISNACASGILLQSNDLFAWDVLLSQLGSYITNRRLELMSQIRQLLNETYFQVTDSRDTIELDYFPNFSQPKQIEQQFFRSLTTDPRNLTQTVTGPHRHDFELRFNHRPADKHVSRGETRSLVVALKLIETKLLGQTTAKKPLILLDDVLSELDEQRQSALMSAELAEQVFLTSTSYQGLSKDFKLIKL